MKTRYSSLALAMGLAISGSVIAAVSEEQAQQLGDNLTLWGAEKAGNAEETIPAYTGGVEPPASYDPSRPGIRPDPFADEQVLFTIDASNYTEHQEQLTSAAVALFEKYPEFKINVYPSHRTARYPQHYLDAAKKNATSCTLVADGLQLQGCWAGTPFPVPQSGIEVMWNRYMKYEGHAFMSQDLKTTIVDGSGSVIDTAGQTQWNQYPLWDPSRTEPLEGDEINEMLRADYDSPTRKSGEKLIIHDSLNMLTNARRAWSYLPGQRRVKLSPDVAYDTPSPAGAGIGTVDDSSVFYGAFDRYDFELMGKKEVYLPYNMFKMYDTEQCGRDEVFTKNFANPDCVRWELHRVWVVEATLKEGKRHIYPRRTFYWDEDYLGVGMSASYDSTGAVYRVVHSESFPKYEGYGHISGQFITHDLASGAYARQAYSTGRSGWYDIEPKPMSFFSPQAMSAGGVR
ncbi:DUF1329 domain-containing protein [Pseudomonas profundi]|uniref:DUF1329 domain-containing protein n=1 Tax=Pseudomonas profundi TaxID=1981513 RepID=UPI0012391BE8|nr:DUF1329 domain-containing protein [Pseudomonas profundi]